MQNILKSLFQNLRESKDLSDVPEWPNTNDLTEPAVFVTDLKTSKTKKYKIKFPNSK